jgi:FG-GAP-like repeat
MSLHARTITAALILVASGSIHHPAHAQIGFSPYSFYPLPGWGEGHAVAFGDFDHDGDVDLAAAATFNPIDGRITVFKNNGAGVFGSPVSYPTGGSVPTGLAATDLNQDGWLDLTFSLFSPGASVKTLINDQTGLFASGQTLESGNATRLAAGDLNGDGWPDVVSTNSQAGNPTAKVFLNDGGGTLTAGVEYGVASSPRSVTIADLDGDGDQDLAVPSLNAHVVSVLRNQGNGSFASVENIPAAYSCWFVAARDFDGDGDTDMAVSSEGVSVTSDVAILFNSGGTFGAPVHYPIGYDARGIVGEDFDNDGDVDLAVVVMPQAKVFVLANNGHGIFAPPTTFASGLQGDSSFNLAAADVNGDGLIDLGVSNLGINHGVAVLLNTTQVACSPDCDADGSLTIDDFICFQTLFALGDPSADCDASGSLNIDDFICFQTLFALGC